VRGQDIREEDYYLVQDGRVLSDHDRVELSQEAIVFINAFPRILGGKGGDTIVYIFH